MEKLRVTRKQIKESYKNIIEVGYCEIQTLLRYIEPKYYTCGIYGWNADVYELDSDTVVVSGYRPFGNIKADKFATKKIEIKAFETVFRISNYDERKKAISKLIEKFKKEVLEK